MAGEIMRIFIIRFLLFSVLWVAMIVQASSHLIFSLFMLTASLAFFFFLSNPNTSLLVYIILSIILSIHGFIIQDLFYTSILLLLVTMIALFQVSKKEMYYLLSLNFLLAGGLAFFLEKHLLTVILIGSLFVFLLLRLNRMANERSEQKGLYENLLAEYRQLKRLHVSKEEMVKTEERTRIAREIHDSVGHRLTALIMKLEILQIQEKNNHFAELKEMANKSLLETREAVKTLQESETRGITAVVQLIRKLEAESQLLIQFTLKEGVLSVPLSNEHGIVLYRVIQEALTNVMRHSTSKQVHIVIGKSAIGSLSFTISNPIYKKEQLTYGFGLKNMEARVAEIGGQLDIYQTNEEFVVQVMMPIE